MKNSFPRSKMLCTASLCFHFRSKRNSKFKLSSGNDENTMRLLGHQLRHTELLKWNRLTVYRGKNSQFFWVLERCVSPSQDYRTYPFFWNPPAFKVHNKSMLLTSPALHLMYTVKTIKWKSKTIQQGEASGSTSIYKANFSIFPMFTAFQT